MVANQNDNSSCWPGPKMSEVHIVIPQASVVKSTIGGIHEFGLAQLHSGGGGSTNSGYSFKMGKQKSGKWGFRG